MKQPPRFGLQYPHRKQLTMTASSLCKKGMWATEAQAVQLLGIGGTAQLKQKLAAKQLPHVHVEQGKKANVPPPFDLHTFYYVGPVGTAVSRLSMSLSFIQWIELCVALDGTDASHLNPKKLALFAKYAGTGINMKTLGAQVDELKRTKAVIPPSSLGAANKLKLGNFFDSDSDKGKGGNTVEEEGEIFIRADGKKVRRVKKTVIRQRPANGDGSSGGLSSFIGASAVKPAKGSAATVGGSPSGAQSAPESEVYRRADGKLVRRVKRVVPANSAGDLVTPDTPADEGEIFIRPDGTKVRRIRKTVVRPKAGEGEPASSDGLSSFVGTSNGGPMKKVAGAKSVAGMSSKASTEGEVYRNKDGKLVRRVKKSSLAASAPSSSAAGDLDGLDGFLGSTTSKLKKGSGNATVGGDSPDKSKSFTDGEIYIRADGKKVRRVKKIVSKPASDGAGTGGLGGFLAAGESSKPKMSGSATVGGDKPSAKEIGEIFTRPDGTKVRRIKKTIVRTGSAENLNSIATAESNKNPKTSKAGLSAFFGGAPKKNRFGAKSVSGEPDLPPKKVSDSNGLSSFFGGAPKKKMSGSQSVSEVPSSKPASKSTTQGDIYRNKDGKLVRRVTKSSLTASAAGDLDGLDGFMDSTTSKLKEGSSNATVGGDSPTKSKSLADGEIYTRADGKKVRRIKKSALSPSDTEGLEGFMGAGTSEKSKKSGAATVSGDEGEIIIRDGKKILRRKKSTSEASQDGEVYRRADGKLVRRVKRASSSQDLAAMASVNGDDPEDAPGHTAFLKMQAKDQATQERPTTPQTAPLSESSAHENQPQNPAAIPNSVIAEFTENAEASCSPLKQTSSAPTQALSEDDESVVAFYRKKLKFGMPMVAVKTKMEQDNIDASIIAAVTGVSSSQAAPTAAVAVPAPTAAAVVPAPAPAPQSSSSTSLSEDDESVAAFYRKKLKFGMPMVAVTNKMEQDNIDASIIAAVTGEGSSQPVSPAPATPQSSSSTSLSEDEESVAAFYRKKLKFGMPMMAVKTKMEQDDIDARIIAAVTSEGSSQAAPTASAFALAPAPAPQSSSSTSLSEDDESVAAFYRKKLKFGMPMVALKIKMEQDNIDASIIAAVTGEGTSQVAAATAPEPAPAAPPASSSTSLSEDDEAVVAFYRKKLKFGMPMVAVKTKMEQDDIDVRIISIVTNEGSSPAAALKSVAPAPMPSQKKEAASVPKEGAAVIPGGSSIPKELPPGAVAYVVVIGDGDESKPKSKPSGLGAMLSKKESGLSAISDDATVGTTLTVSRDEKFAVNLNADDKAQSTDGLTKTKFLTLDELAKMSGQSRESLENLVLDKRTRGQSPPRFSLQPLEEKDPERFEVAIPARPKSSSSANSAPVPSPAAHAPRPNENMASIKEGEEIVDSGLANTARAVSALGDGDMKALLAKLQSGDVEDLLNKLREAEKRQKKLEKQLAQSGIAIAEDIDYMECKIKVVEIAKRMHEIGGSDVTVEGDKEAQNKLREEYFKLEQGMERYNTALMLTEEYQADQARTEKKWEDDNWPENLEALKKLRRHMPVMIRNMSEAELTNQPSPNGKFLPKAIAKKFKRTNVLQCLRLNPDDLERMHPSTLENMRVTGLTLTERRALYAHLKVLGPRWEKNKAEKMTERKWTWYQMMKNNFKENLAPYQRHVAQYGPPGSHPYATRDDPNVGCPMIGKQCPLKADQLPSYDVDYGFTDKDQFEVSDVKKSDIDDPGAKAMAEALEMMKEKKSNERADLLKKHYKGKLLQVSKANGSCEAMDDSMDKMENHTLKWIEFMLGKGADEKEDDKKKEISMFTEALNEYKLALLDFAQRSGMQVTGKKKAGGDAPDIRSSVECSLSSDMFECAQELFKYINDRMKELSMKDTRVEKTIELLDGMLKELHGKNTVTLEKLGAKRSDRSRKLKKISDMKKETEEKMKPKEGEETEEEASSGPPSGPPGGGGGRGGLLAGISGRGGGGRGGLLAGIAGRGGGGGRGGLLAGIAGRGGGGDGGGRGGLLAGIAGRGRGGGGGGRGGLLAGIAGRGRGGDGGGRGGLLAGIAGRGKSGGGGAAGGRGGLMAAIAAKGGGG
jgi:phosphoribosylaminoimidazole-succinocarboxamide synthase